jgi:type I restriction enzyme M protein
MVAVMRTTFDDMMQDPAAGTGGFLIAASRYLQSQKSPSKWTESEQKKYRRMFHGMEHVQDAHRLYLGAPMSPRAPAGRHA